MVCVQFKCLLESLTHAPQNASGEDGLVSVRGFSLLSFVELTSGEKGILVYIDPTGRSVRLLSPQNSLLHVSSSQLLSKLNTDLQSARDAFNCPVERNAWVSPACTGCGDASCSCRGSGIGIGGSGSGSDCVHSSYPLGLASSMFSCCLVYRTGSSPSAPVRKRCTCRWLQLRCMRNEGYIDAHACMQA